MATDAREIKSLGSSKDEKRKVAIFICNAGAGIADDDYASQDTEIEKLCTHRIMEAFVEDPDGDIKTFTLENGAYDTRIKPLLYVGGSPKLGDDGTYAHTWAPATGKVTFTTAPATGVELTATVDGRQVAFVTVDIPGVTVAITQADITAIGATAAVESTRNVGQSTFSDAVVTVMPNVNVDVLRQAETYPGQNFECYFYGTSQWPNDDSVKEYAMNSNPAVMRVVYYDEADSTTVGDVKYKETRIYGLKFSGFKTNQVDATNKAHTQTWNMSCKNVKTRLVKVTA